MKKNTNSLVTITPSAIEQIRKMISQRETPTLGIRIFVTTKGCSGLSYAMEYVEKKLELDEEINKEGIKLFISPKAIMFILGSEIDYKENKIESGFRFNNPNEKGRCGCGESFHV